MFDWSPESLWPMAGNGLSNGATVSAYKWCGVRCWPIGCSLIPTWSNYVPLDVSIYYYHVRQCFVVDCLVWLATGVSLSHGWLHAIWWGNRLDIWVVQGKMLANWLLVDPRLIELRPSRCPILISSCTMVFCLVCVCCTDEYRPIRAIHTGMLTVHYQEVSVT